MDNWNFVHRILSAIVIFQSIQEYKLSWTADAMHADFRILKFPHSSDGSSLKFIQSILEKCGEWYQISHSKFISQKSSSPLSLSLLT